MIERFAAMVPGVTRVDAELTWKLDDRQIQAPERDPAPAAGACLIRSGASDARYLRITVARCQPPVEHLPASARPPRRFPTLGQPRRL